MRKIKVNYHLGLFFIIVSCLFFSGYAYALVSKIDMKVIIVFLGFIGCYLIRPFKGVSFRVRRSMPLVMILCILLGALLSYIFYLGKNMWLDPALLIGIMIVAYMLTERISFDKFAGLFSTGITYITLLGIIVWCLVQIGLDVPCFIYDGLSGLQYKTVWFYTWSDINNRFMGPLWEPGLYSSVAIYAVLCEGCFTKRKIRPLYLVILTIGILLSQSTAGYLLIILALYIVIRQRRQFKWFWDVFVAISVILGFMYSEQLLAFLVNWKPEVFWKFVQSNMAGNTRLYSPLACFFVFKQNPFTGLGLSYAIERYNEYKPLFGMDSLTSTNVFFLSAFGVWGISYTVTWIRAIMRRKEFALFSKILLAILFFSILNKEPHYNNMLTYVLLFYLCKQEKGVFINNESNKNEIPYQ